MPVYSLRGSYSTVQVLSATLTQPVVYCTIETIPSSVIASIPIDAALFGQNEGNRELEVFAEAIEKIMTLPGVIAGVGNQTIDPTGLLGDFVTFVVQYPDPPTAGTSNTAEADVPVTLLDFSDPNFGAEILHEAEAIITGVYNNLQNIAAG